MRSVGAQEEGQGTRGAVMLAGAYSMGLPCLQLWPLRVRVVLHHGLWRGVASRVARWQSNIAHNIAQAAF